MQKENIFSKIVRQSILNPKLIIVTTIAILVASIYSLNTIKFDVLPEINKPLITVFAPVDGLASEEVEALVLTPLESAILGAPGVEKVRGAASFGQAIVTIEFSWGTDIYKNRQIVQEYIRKANLPSGVQPELAPPSSIMGEFMWVGLTNKDGGEVNARDLRSIADWVIRPALLQVKGVSDVLVQGGEVKELRIEIDQEKLNNYNLSFNDVVSKLKGTFNNASGGLLISKGKEYPIRLLSPFTDAINQAGNIVIGTDKNIILSQVAKVKYADSPVRGSASVDGKSGVILRVVKQSDVETISLTKDVDTKLEEIKNSLPAGVVIFNDLFRQETFISTGLSNVESALVESGIMVIIITFLFLLSWRATSITILAIPLSLLISFIVFRLLGMSINVMTLGGLAIAIGELVDDAIIGVENSLRRLGDKKFKEKSITDTIVFAISEVRSSIIYATILVAIVFVPLLLIPGIEGKLLAPLGIAYIVSLIASLIVSVTISPLMMRYGFKKSDDDNHSHESTVAKSIRLKVEQVVVKSIKYPKYVLGLTVLSIIVSIGLYIYAGKEGIPPFNEGSFTVNLLTPYGTDVATTKNVSEKVTAELKKIDGVMRVGSTVGRAGSDPHDSGSNQSEIAVVYSRDDKQSSLDRNKAIQNVLANFSSEGKFSIGQPITHKVEELLSGVRAPIVIKVFGSDLKNMSDLSEEIKNTLAAQPGVTNPTIKKAAEIGEIRIYLDANKLINRNVVVNEYLEGFDGSMIGTQVGEERKGIERTPIIARLNSSAQNNPESLQDISIDSLDINTIGAIRVENGINRINHENGRRFITISANYSGKDIVGAVQNVVDTYKDKKLETGLSISYEGNYKSQKDSSKTLGIAFVVVLVLMFFILQYAFNSSRLAIITIANIPTAFLGSMLAIAITGFSVSLAHIVGFISLSGIVARNGIMLISKIKDKESELGVEEVNDKILLESVSERITPVLITSLVTGLALVPLLLSSDAPGKEMLYPLAVVLTGGLITSTLASFFITPALYKLFVKNNTQK